MDNKFENVNCELDNSNWYFYNENVKLDKLEVFNDSDYIFFCNASLISKDSVKMVYDISSIDRGNDLFFSIINNNTYKHRPVNVGNTNYHLYLLKSDSVYIDTITKKILPYRIRQERYFDSIQNTFVESMNFISSFYKKDKDINIIEINWENSDYSFGRGYKNKITDDGYIRCDSEFLFNRSITHECLHFLCDINADKQESGYLFFNESIIETFTIYSLRKNKGLDSVFNETHRFYIENFNTNTTSIFDITENNKDSWGIIYFKVPYVLYEFSKTNNTEMFWEVFSSFMKLNLEKVSWSDFQDYFIKQGYSKKQMEKLKSLL